MNNKEIDDVKKETKLETTTTPTKSNVPKKVSKNKNEEINFKNNENQY